MYIISKTTQLNKFCEGKILRHLISTILENLLLKLLTQKLATFWYFYLVHQILHEIKYLHSHQLTSPCQYTTTKHINCTFLNIHTHLQNKCQLLNSLILFMCFTRIAPHLCWAPIISISQPGFLTSEHFSYVTALIFLVSYQQMFVKNAQI